MSIAVPHASENTAVTPRAERRRRRPLKVTFGAVAMAVALFATTACSPQDVAQVAVDSHWPAHTRDCAMRVIAAESGYRADARSAGGGNLGLFQVNSVHDAWIQRTFGYRWADLTDPMKNAQVAQALSLDSHRRTGDGWAPWRFGGANPTGCPR